MGVTVKELSEGILAVCIGGKERLERDLHLIREGSLKEVGEDLALAELFMMRVSLAAYFVQQFLRANVQEEARQAFNHKLQAALTNSGDARLMSQPNKAIDEFNKRYGAYMRAIETPHHLGLPWNVGKVFAKLCRPEHEMDIDVIMAGATEFGATGAGVAEYLKMRKSMDGGEVIRLPEKEPPLPPGRRL